jgi:hypothetical protein
LFHDRIFLERTRLAGIVWPALVILTFAVAGAEGQERQYTIGPTVDLVSGSDSHPLNTLTTLTPGPSSSASFFRLYPSISLGSIGGQSTLKATYALGVSGTRSDTDYNTVSHSAILTYTYRPPTKWKFNLTESFLSSSDSTSFNELRGTTLPPEQFGFLFNPVALKITTRTNNANIVTQYAFNPRSSLSVTGSHSLLNYASGAGQNAGLANQQFITGTIDYIQKITARDAWRVGYTAGYIASQNFGNSVFHNAHVGYSLGIATDVTLDITVGTSRVGTSSNVVSQPTTGTAESYVGYNTAVSITKTKLDDTFSIRYRQDSGQPTGIGGVSNTRLAGVSVGHRVGTIMFFLDATAFDGQGTLGAILQTRGVTGAASIGIPLTPTLSVSGGYQYQRYDQAAPFGFTQQRLFVTLKYNDPNLWTIFR